MCLELAHGSCRGGEERKLSSRMGNETSKICTLSGLPILV